MIPFQTILALLSLLVLTSCSQTSPPHTTVEKLSQKEAVDAQGGGQNTIPANDGTNVVKPGLNTANVPDQTQTTTGFDLSTDGQIDFRVSGISAKSLFDLMAVKTEVFMDGRKKLTYKNGSDVSCVKSSAESYCTFSIATSDGSAIESIDKEKLEHEEPSVKFAKGELTKNLTGADPSVGTIAKLWMIIAKNNDDNKKLYDSLKASEKLITIKGNDSAYEKEGKSIFCQKLAPTGKPAGTLWYSCYVYLDVSTGSASPITVARPLF